MTDRRRCHWLRVSGFAPMAGRVGPEARLSAPPHRRAFTLIEVILAIGIAAAILTVVLFFYRQSEILRDRLLEETSRLSAARLVMERLQADLAAARRCESFQQGLEGGPDYLQFVRLDFPRAEAWTNLPGAFPAASPFRLVRYSLLQDTNADAQGGLMRSDQPLSPPVASVSTGDSNAAVELDLPEPSPDATTSSPDATASSPTNLPTSSMTSKQVQYLRFRYYDGASWLDNWSAATLPVGIEVSLGNDPLPPELTPEEYPSELYRRVIYLPNHAAGATPSRAEPADSTTTNTEEAE